MMLLARIYSIIKVYSTITTILLIISFNHINCNLSDNFEGNSKNETENDSMNFSELDQELNGQQEIYYNISSATNTNTNDSELIINSKSEYNKIKLLSKYFKLNQGCSFAIDEQQTHVNNNDNDNNSTHCKSTADYLLCFSSVPKNTTVHLPCPYIDIIQINESDSVMVSRYCNENATWEAADYQICVQHLVSQIYKTTCRKVNKSFNVNNTIVIKEVVVCDDVQIAHNDMAIRLLPHLFLIGYSVSLVPVSLALIIFCSIRSLRCLRNMIHSNMLLTFILKSLTFIAFKLYLSNTKNVTDKNPIVCLIFQILWHYSLLTSFFWMMIEGIYLISVVIAAYSSSKIKLWWYLLIGWVLPLIPLFPYTIFTVSSSNITCNWIRSENDSLNELFIDIPIYIVLGINFILLVIILGVIIKKLRDNNDAAKARYNRYKKLIRATLLLFPLLGLTYGMFFWLPSNPKTLLSKTYCYINIFFQTTQGIWVAVVYCFYNEEVNTVLTNKFRSWKSTQLSIYQIVSLKKKSQRNQSVVTTLTSFSRTRLSTQINDPAAIPMIKKANLKENEPVCIIDSNNNKSLM